MKWHSLLFLIVSVQPLLAEALIATRTIRAHTVLTSADLAFSDATIPGAAQNPANVVGLEARVVLYAGRPILLSAVGPAALVERNQIVILTFSQNGLKIATEGRALARGAADDLIRVMNLSSRSTVTGRVTDEGTIEVAK